METKKISEATLLSYLLQHIPSLEAIYREEVEGQGYHGSYPIFSWVLRPHIEKLLLEKDEKELHRIFRLLEYIANHSDAAVLNELAVVMDEEVDMWKFRKFLGKTMRHDEIMSITWIPEQGDNGKPINTHVDKTHYQQRWLEEISKIGGFEHLTDAHELLIRYKLVKEFGIEGLRTIEPGGEEWRAIHLPWPLP